MNSKVKEIAKDFAYLIVGCFILAVSISVFLAPNKISAGGVSSVGTVLLHLFGIKMSVSNLFFNAILFFFGYKSLGKYACVQTAVGTVVLSLFLEITSHFPVYGENLLIAVLSGGVLMGIGIGFIVKRGGSTGGSDFAGLILKKIFPHISIAKLIMVIDCAIVILSGVVFKSYTVTVYSIVALFISSVVTDKLLTVGDSAKMIQILSPKAEEIADRVMKEYERGVTGVFCRGMYSKSDSLMLMCVVTPKELPMYMNIIREIDKSAFVVIDNIREVIGEGFKEMV